MEAGNRDRIPELHTRKVCKLEARAKISCYHFVKLLPQTVTVLCKQNKPWR